MNFKIPKINWKKFRTPFFISLGLLILLGVYFYVEYILSDFYLLDINVHDEMDNIVPNDRIRLKLEYTKIRLQILSSFVVILGIGVAFWRAYIADKTANAVLKQVKVADKTASAALKQAEIANENIELARDSQITDRFTKAIEQLGSDKIEVRLGAIYALSRLAKESEKDHESIMKIFASYIRENSKVEDYKESENVKIKEDIYTICSVLRPNENVHNIDLSSSYLVYVNLNFAELSNANFVDANLSGANLANANLVGAKLYGAKLYGTTLMCTDLLGCDLKHADLSRANLWEVKNISSEQLIKCRSLYETKGIPPRIENRLRKEKPCLFTKEGCPDNFL